MNGENCTFADYGTSSPHVLNFLVAGWQHMHVSVKEGSLVSVLEGSLVYTQRIQLVWVTPSGEILQCRFSRKKLLASVKTVLQLNMKLK